MIDPGYTAAEQRELAAALARPGPLGPGPIECIETHVSWVFLAGEFAWKLKKKLDLGFLDYSTLERRRFCGEEELRINRRTAPALYLDLVAVGGAPDAPRLGPEMPARDYLVRMRRFPAGSLLSERLARGELEPPLLDELARTLARFHLALPPAPAESPFGEPEAVHFPVRQNFAQIAERLPSAARRLLPVREWAEAAFTLLQPLLARRKAEGFIRECHGDLHLGNVALIDGRPVPFDAIDFNPGLRFIDVMSEVAFLTMDLTDRGSPELAARVLNLYLEQTGDFGGLALLRYYQCYRAMVRAKVAAIRAGQEGLPAEAADTLREEFEAYAALAARYTRPGRPALILTRGPSGAGKTTATAPLLGRLGAVRVRSDVERKRLFGLPPEARTGSAVAGGVYGGQATAATYQRLLEAAGQALAAGLPVVVDATFPEAAQREPFRALARRLALPYLLIDFRLPPVLLRERVAARQAAGGDASEADLAVLERQLAGWPTLPAGEEAEAMIVGPETAPELAVRVASALGGG